MFSLQVYLSHHNQRVRNMKCPSNMVQKVDIQEVVENGVLFQDGSYEQVDSILYCTGKQMKCITSRKSFCSFKYFLIYILYCVKQLTLF